MVRLHDLLSSAFAGCRTNHTKAALKAHVVMSVRGAGASSVKVTAERRHDGPVFKVGPWIKDHLLLFDLGYFRYQLFDSIRRNGGYFVTRLKKSANPTIVEVHRVHRGRAIKLVGEKLRDVIARLDRELLDVEIEVEFTRRVYAGRRSRARQRLRVVGQKDTESGEYHLYVTNLPVDRLRAEDVAIIYSLRWQVELLFKELKSNFRLEDMPSRKRVVVEALLYAALLTLVASRQLLRVVQKHLGVRSERIPPQRWAAVFVSVAHELLLIVTRRTAKVREALRSVTRLLLHEAVDPNRRRNGLLAAVETGKRRRDELGSAS